MTLDDNGQNTVHFIEGDGFGVVAQNGEMLANYGGTVNFYGGSPNGIGNIDFLNVPVNNQGSFNLFGAGTGSGSSGATLKVLGSYKPNQWNVSFYSSGSSNNPAFTYLAGNVTLYADQGYMQNLTSYLEDGDTYVETVQVPVERGAITIGGGSHIMFGPKPSGFGTLYLQGNVTMNGELDANIDGQNGSNDPNAPGAHCDYMKVFGNMNWGTGSTISVSIEGTQLIEGLKWELVFCSGALTTNYNQIPVSPTTLKQLTSDWTNGWVTVYAYSSLIN